MGSLKRPSRLIEFAPAKPSKKKIQPRVVVYGIGYLIILGIFSYGLYSRSDVEVTSIRQARSSSTIYEDGRGANFFQLRLTNTTGKSVDIRIESLSPGVQLICGLCAKKLAPYESRRASLVVVYQKEYDDAHAKGLIVFKGGNKKLNLPLIKSKRGQK
jgi:hypothetical protein